ncbi:MAG: DUF5110 domain-containing protein, partial [Armatimonadetes bacterium]|nr:DUF5110 domain-containing protein [Armatimonadota bacterium]
ELPTGQEVDLSKPTFVVAVPPGWSGESEFRYVADDGLSYAYRNGGQSVLVVKLMAKGGKVELTTTLEESGFGPVQASFALLTELDSVKINGKPVKTAKGTDVFTGDPISVFRAVTG